MHIWDRFTPIEETMGALDDLVRSGKVRYIGISDAPAWKVAQAQVMAHFRGWSSLVALQIEYSLMQRTVEGELIPMAEELGVGVLPWGPLKSGALTGKYTRANGARMQGMQGMMVGNFTGKQYDIVDTVATIATDCNADSSTVALAWLRAQPGVRSTLVGARTMEQLNANLKVLDLTLTPEQIASLDDVSRPTPYFPAEFLVQTTFGHAGVTVNGVPSRVMPFVPKDDSARW